MRIITTIVALLLAVANVNSQENMKENVDLDNRLTLGYQQTSLHDACSTVDFNVWPKGELNTAYAQYFIGNSYLAPLGGENGLVNVTFEPRCRNNWHIHHKSVQVLVCVAGYGWYVEEGKEPVVLRPGVVVAIPAEAKHWHGAAKDSWMQHLTYMTKVEEGASNEWLEPVSDAEYDKLPASSRLVSLSSADAEYMQRFEAFAFGEVVEQVKTQLDDHTRYICYLATLLGCQGIDEYRELLPEALDKGVTPVEVKEIVYQSTAYLGMGRVRPFLTVTNEVLAARGIALPLASQQTTTMETRRASGTEAQVGCFGDSMRDFWKSGPEDSRHFNKWLADNCFGDYYTRTGLDLKMRELITFCFLAAQGGCEPQLKGHIAGNYHVGNDKDMLIAVISSNLPFIGYPRTLNALSCIRSVESDK